MDAEKPDPTDLTAALPPALIDALRAETDPAPLITARTDRFVAAQAKAHFGGRVPGRRSVRLAAAAAVLAVAGIIYTLLPPPLPDDPAFADVDGSGQVDIADVFALARRTGPNAPTQDELDAFARRVVSLTHEQEPG